MKRITTNDDIRFPISVVKGLNSDVFTIQFYTTNKAVSVTKTNADVEDGIIHLEWTELYPLGTGVMNYTVLVPEVDGSFSDDTFNRSISGTTIFYIVSNIIVPDGDDAQNLIDIVADLQNQVDSNTAKIEQLLRVTVNSSNWSATALQAPNTRYIISGNLDFDVPTQVSVGDNCQIEFPKGSSLGSNVELMINNAEIVAPLIQIFDGTKITGFFHNAQIPVEWFGAKGDGETDDAAAINTTIRYAGKSEVLLSAPIYVIGSTIDINETNANFDTYEGQVESSRNEEGGKKFLCKGSIYSTSNFTGYTVGNVTVPAMIRLAASNTTVRIEGAIVVHADLTDCIGFLHEGYHDNKVYIARVMKARDYIGMWSWLDGTNTYTNQALMNLGTCDGVVYIYAMGGDFECEQICGFNNAFMVNDKYATAYAGVQQASFKFASLTANYGIRIRIGHNDGLIHPSTTGWMNACRIEFNGISGDNESRRFIPTTDATFIKVDCDIQHQHFCQNRIICNSVEPVWYKLMDINTGRSDYFEFLGNFGDCHTIPYNNGVPDDKNLGESAPTDCYNGLFPYTNTNKFINIRNCKDFLINNVTPFYPMPHDTIYVHGSSNIVFTNCQAAEYTKDYWYQYVDSERRYEKVIFTVSDVTDLTSTDITVFEPDSREMDSIAYVESANDIDLTVERLNIVTTPTYTTKFNVYPLFEVKDGTKSQLGYCYDYKGLIASNNALQEGLSHVTVDAYTKAETNALLAGKANKNGSASETFSTNGLNLQRDGAATTLYNYIDGNGREYISFYDRTGGSLTYQFTANQSDDIATTRQLSTKANSADVYSKSEVYTKGEVDNLIPDNIVTDANYVHTDNNYTTADQTKLSGIASGAEVNVQANWNETNSSSDAYIQNKPTIPTVDSSITGSSQTNAVQGGAIYNALLGKAGFKQYNSKQAMEADSSISSGTIAFETDEELFYIYDGINAEWRRIDETGGGTGDGKQLTLLKFSVARNTLTLKDLEDNALSLEESLNYLKDTNKELVLIGTDEYFYRQTYYDYSDYFHDWIFSSNTQNGAVKLYNFSYYDEEGSEDEAIGASSTTVSPITSPTQIGGGYAIVSSSSSSSTITATSNTNFQLVSGGIIVVSFAVAVNAGATLNIQSKGAKAIYYQGAAIQAGVINAGDLALMYYYNNRWNLICTDHPASGGGGTQVQSDWEETDTTSLAYIQNKPTIPDLTADSNVITATALKVFDGIDNYVQLSGDYDSDFDCNTILFNDLFSGNSAQFRMAPGGYALNLGVDRHTGPTNATVTSGVANVELESGYNIMQTRLFRNVTGVINFNLKSPNYGTLVIPEYYVYFPYCLPSTIKVTNFTFNCALGGYNPTVLWKDGIVPDVLSVFNTSSAEAIVILRAMSTSLVLGEMITFKPAST